MKTEEKDKVYEIVYMCDDALGLPELISKTLGISQKNTVRRLNKLIKEGLISKDKKSNWYETTELGKKYLRKKYKLEKSK